MTHTPLSSLAQRALPIPALVLIHKHPILLVAATHFHFIISLSISNVSVPPTPHPRILQPQTTTPPNQLMTTPSSSSSFVQTIDKLQLTRSKQPHGFNGEVTTTKFSLFTIEEVYEGILQRQLASLLCRWTARHATVDSRLLDVSPTARVRCERITSAFRFASLTH
jgi:hypothetical protein